MEIPGSRQVWHAPPPTTAGERIIPAAEKPFEMIPPCSSGRLTIALTCVRHLQSVISMTPRRSDGLWGNVLSRSRRATIRRGGHETMSRESDPRLLTSFEGRDIAWERLAEPQNDQYDSKVVLERPGPRVCRPATGDAPTIFDGTVAVRNSCRDLGPDCEFTGPDHPNVTKGCDLIRAWPNAYTQVKLLIDSVNLFLHTKRPTTMTASDHVGLRGERVRGGVDDRQQCGGVRGIDRPRARAPQAKGPRGAIRDGRATDHQSPRAEVSQSVRYDCLRPMSAVLQGQYAFTYSAAVCLEIIRPGEHPERDRRIAEQGAGGKTAETGLRSGGPPEARGGGCPGGCLPGRPVRLVLPALRGWIHLLETMKVPIKRFAHPLSV